MPRGCEALHPGERRLRWRGRRGQTMPLASPRAIRLHLRHTTAASASGHLICQHRKAACKRRAPRRAKAWRENKWGQEGPAVQGLPYAAIEATAVVPFGLPPRCGRADEGGSPRCQAFRIAALSGHEGPKISGTRSWGPRNQLYLS